MNILLVDDEPYILRSLREMIEGARADWHIVGAVEDGEEAISVLKREEVDLVISDIKMPALDGIQLIQFMQKHFPTTKVILLSGYQDFEYAQQAIRHGVTEYILKPSSLETIVQSIERIDLFIKGQQNKLKLQRSREKEILEKRLDDLLFDLPSPYYDRDLYPAYENISVFTCSLRNSVLPHGWQEPTAYSAIKNVAEEWLASFGQCFAIIQDQHICVIVFLNKAEPLGEEPALAMIAEFRQTVSKLLKIELTVGVGLVCTKLETLSKHYKESIRALEEARLNGAHIANSGELQEEMLVPGHLEQTYEVKKNRRVIEIVLAQMENRLKEDLSLKTLAEIVYLNPTYLGRIFKEETGENFSNYLIQLRMNKAKQLLGNPCLKVYEVCEEIGYSDPAHFTHVFKRTVGVTPHEYKTRAQIN
ncbi:response regulator [Paenibacillus thalictri]|uniref:Response regulator n=1 Tax=Paenibacillus thalictri TaxID=2527873 RepID=A0A4V2J380_9BACL|nr:response regulator [Paenibacillus thalictri]TBL70315.1 response regulator [Paenibacillus thalictri]